MQAEIWQLQRSLVVKQDDVTRLNLEGAPLMADLSYAKQGLYDQQSQGRQLAGQLAASQKLAQQASGLASQAASEDEYVTALLKQVTVATENAETLFACVRELELALATSQATLASQQEFAAELRAHLETRKQKGETLSTSSNSIADLHRSRLGVMLWAFTPGDDGLLDRARNTFTFNALNRFGRHLA